MEGVEVEVPMSPFNVVLGFILFMIPLGVMLENAYELERFSKDLKSDMRSNESVIVAIKAQLSETQRIMVENIKSAAAVREERRIQIGEILERVRAHDKIFTETGVDRLTRLEMQTWVNEFFPMLPPLPKINSPGSDWHPPLLPVR